MRSFTIKCVTDWPDTIPKYGLNVILEELCQQGFRSTLIWNFFSAWGKLEVFKDHLYAFKKNNIKNKITTQVPLGHTQTWTTYKRPKKSNVKSNDSHRQRPQPNKWLSSCKANHSNLIPSPPNSQTNPFRRPKANAENNRRTGPDRSAFL